VGLSVIPAPLETGRFSQNRLALKTCSDIGLKNSFQANGFCARLSARSRDRTQHPGEQFTFSLPTSAARQNPADASAGFFVFGIRSP